MSREHRFSCKPCEISRGLSDEVAIISAGPSPSAAAGVSLPFLFWTAILSLDIRSKDARQPNWWSGVPVKSRRLIPSLVQTKVTPEVTFAYAIGFRLKKPTPAKRLKVGCVADSPVVDPEWPYTLEHGIVRTYEWRYTYVYIYVDDESVTVRTYVTRLFTCSLLQYYYLHSYY